MSGMVDLATQAGKRKLPLPGGTTMPNWRSPGVQPIPGAPAGGAPAVPKPGDTGVLGSMLEPPKLTPPITAMPNVAPPDPKMVMTGGLNSLQEGTTYTPPPAPGPMVQAPGPAQGVADNQGTMVRNPMPAPIQGPLEPPPASKANQAYDSALDAILKGVQDDQPLPGTQAAITQSRQAVATYAKSAQNRAAMQAAKTGAIGQGTANTMANAVRGDVLGELANSELNNTKLVSAEKQGLIDKAVQAGQFGMQRDDQRQQFVANMEQRKLEFDKNFGADEAQSYRNQLERMATDNPILASKLTNYLLEGKTGALGEFTPQEKADITKYAAEKKGQQDKLTEVMNTIIGAIPGQLAASNKADADAAKKAEEAAALGESVKRMNSLSADQFLTEADFKALEASQDIKRLSLSSMPTGPEANASYAGKVVSIDGKQYRYVKSDNITTDWKSRGLLPDKRAHTSYVEAVDSSGKRVYIYDGKVNSAPPKKDSNPY